MERSVGRAAPVKLHTGECTTIAGPGLDSKVIAETLHSRICGKMQACQRLENHNRLVCLTHLPLHAVRCMWQDVTNAIMTPGVVWCDHRVHQVMLSTCNQQVSLGAGADSQPCVVGSNVKSLPRI